MVSDTRFRSLSFGVFGVAFFALAPSALAAFSSCSTVSPSSTPAGATVVISITGSGLTSGAATTATVNGVSATNVSSSSTTVTATAPALDWSGSPYAVAVTQGGVTKTCSGTLTYENPTISSVTTGGTGGGAFGSTVPVGAPGYSVSVTGTNFVSGATIVFDSFGNGPTTVSSSTSLSASVYGNGWPAGSGTVYICNPGTMSNSNCSASLTFVFIAPPTFSSVSPNTVSVSTTPTLTVTGTNLATIGGFTICMKIIGGGGAICSSSSATSISESSMAMPSTQGTYALRVYGGDSTHQGNDNNGLFVDAGNVLTVLDTPTVTSITGANPQTTAGGYGVTITGTNFWSGDSVFLSGGGSFSNVSVVNATTITATAPAAAAGSWAVQVSHPATGQTSAAGGSLQYIAPPTGTLSIDQAYVSTTTGASRTVSTTGGGMWGAAACGVKVDTTCLTTTGSATSMTFTTVAHAAGGVVIRVYGTSGSDSNGIFLDSAANFLTFEAPPTITSVTPDNSLDPNGGQTVTVVGTGMQVSGLGATVDTTPVATAGSSTTITFTTPAHALGAVTLLVYSSHGTAANGISTPYSPFTYQYPVSGNAYADEATTVWSGCNGTTQNISLVINGGTQQTTSCNASTGSYQFNRATIAANNPVSVFFNAGNQGVVVTVASSATASMTLNPRQNIVWLTTEGAVANITNTNLSHCASASPAQCANVPYSVSGGALTVANTAELHVASGKTFAPGGTVTTSPGGANGNIHIMGTMTVGTNAVSVGGSWNNAGTFTKSSGQTTTFTATSTGKTITPASSNFDALTFNGAGGGWTPQANLTADGTITVTNGTCEVGTTTVTAANVTVNGGTLSMTGSGGALKISGSGALSMSSGAWTTLQVAVAPQLTTSNTATPTYVGVNLTGGTLDVGQLSTSYLKNTGFVIGSGVTIGRFDNVTWSSTNQTTAGTDVMLDLTSQSVVLAGHAFPASWSGGEYNVRLTTAGLIKMLGASGAFSGSAKACDSQTACAAGTGVIKWLAGTTLQGVTVQGVTVNQ